MVSLPARCTPVTGWGLDLDDAGCTRLRDAMSKNTTEQVIELDPGESVKLHVKAKRKGKPDPGPGPGPGPEPDWPNEPPGLTVWEEKWAMSDPVPPGPPPPDPPYTDDPIGEGSTQARWRIVYNHPPGSIIPNDPAYGPWAGTPYGWTEHDAAENAMAFRYPTGMRLGIAPSTVYTAWGIQANYRRMYVGCSWMPSTPFDFDNVGQKIWFFFNGGGGTDPTVSGGQAFLAFATNGLVALMPEYPDPPPSSPLYRIRWPNVNQTVVTLGEWHKLEMYMQIPETSDGPCLTQWWLDGLLQGEYHDIWNRAPFDMFQFSPTWGGNGDFFKTELDTYCFKNAHVSVGQLVTPARAVARGASPADWASPPWPGPRKE